MASPGTTITLKQGDIDVLVSLCKQFADVDNARLGKDLGISPSAARMRWTRLKNKVSGDKKKGGDAEDDAGTFQFTTRPPRSTRTTITLLRFFLNLLPHQNSFSHQ